MKLSITLISVLPGLNFAAPLDEESHYCFDNGDVLRCLSLDRFGVAFLTEDTLADNAKLNCKSWGPLTPSHGTYHGLGVEPFTLKSIRGHVEMQIAGELSPVLLRAVHPESPKSLNGLASVFVVDEPKCEIELSAFNPDRVWVNWTEEVTEGVVTPDYPFIATWSNKGEDGTALLFKLDAEPFVLAKHKATGRDAKRCLLIHRYDTKNEDKEAYWSNESLGKWVTDVRDSPPFKPPPIPTNPPSRRTELSRRPRNPRMRRVPAD